MTDSKMREAFEKWAVSEGMPITRGHYYDVYASVETRAAYLAWQAAQSVPVVGEVVAWLNLNKQGDVTRAMRRRDNWCKTPVYSAPTHSISSAELEWLLDTAQAYGEQMCKSHDLREVERIRAAIAAEGEK